MVIGWTLFTIWALLTFMSVYANYNNSNLFMFHIDVNTFKTPFFELGLSNRHWHDDEGNCIETYTVGLFLINVQVDFLNVEMDEEEGL